MSALSKEEIEAKKKRFFEMLKDYDFICLSREKQSEMVGVDRVTLWKWQKEIPAKEWEKIRDDGRRRYAEYAPQIDAALIKKCLKGSEKAMEIFYQKYEGWSPKHTTENINKEPIDQGTKDQIMAAWIKANPKKAKQLLEPTTLEVQEPKQAESNG